MAKQKNIAGFLLKAAISIAAIAYVGFKLTEVREFAAGEASLLDVLLQIPKGGGPWIAAGVLLLGLNIGLEAQKWRLLLKDIYPDLDFFTAFRAVLTGMTTGIFTPNRVGEYAGRVLYLEKGHRIEATILTLLDRLSQMFVTLIAGAIALPLVMHQFKSELIENLFQTEAKFFAFIVLLILFPIGILIIALRPVLLVRLLKKTGLKHKWLDQTETTLENVKPAMLRKVLGLAMLRFCVYSAQYILLMYAFGYEGGLLAAVSMVIMFFLIKSLVPFVGLTELGVRETAAIEIMGLYGVPTLVAFKSTLLLYLVNILFPSVLGIAFLYGLKLRGKRENA